MVASDAIDNALIRMRKIAADFADRGAASRIVGAGAGRFLLVELESRGFELYPDFEAGGWILDPADGDELLGEVHRAPSSLAAEDGWDWLSAGDRPR